MTFTDFFEQFSPFIDYFVSMLGKVIKIFFDIRIFDIPIIVYPLFFGFVITLFCQIFKVGVEDND